MWNWKTLHACNDEVTSFRCVVTTLVRKESDGNCFRYLPCLTDSAACEVHSAYQVLGLDWRLIVVCWESAGGTDGQEWAQVEDSE